MPVVVAPPPAAPPRPAPTNVRVEIASVAFGPDLTIDAGSTVIWTNRDPVDHDVASMDGAWASTVLKPGESYQRRFDQPGVVRYVCTLHALIMQSTVTVR